MKMQRLESFTQNVFSHQTGKCLLWGQNVDITVKLRGAGRPHTHFYTMQFSRFLCMFVKWRGIVREFRYYDEKALFPTLSCYGPPSTCVRYGYKNEQRW
jgi:hypothetical protein